ncbi:hypothetical protein COCSUDRAFT_65173 [Coccomyxa subellipsoidea C-169]|uniref:Uncharacterized protein n=1 Tax=Coccomyxa subellipsoidea (strain C-169) TaxID=574566 RepID=I0Z3Q3_COCSC|nr:hypothetical protein COCSUDRAFT_65173 [Coccomyxa subellipsoidea C-169]EIE25272.1 hypothetical protein COCSUDRAFT_65173 [Coccomyxa subellipsoidea C-169]|eukprot:XP_005649816.1 hypothetical protein COCSUDRAFT_65173 [Coccomyxa subellipsoidea C-169]
MDDAEASLGVYAEFDLQSGCKLGSTEASGTSLVMSYSPEGSQLLVLTAERSIVAFSLPGWKRRVLVPPSSRYNMQKAHMAVLPDKAGNSVVFCQNGSTSVRCVSMAGKATAKGSKEKPGGQLKSDLKRPIVALAASHTERQSLLLLHADALIAVGTGSGTVAAYDAVGSTEPRLIGVSSTSGPVQSVSISLAPSRVLAAVQDVRGEVHLEAWSILFGADRTTWLHEKVVPDRLNEVCGASTSSTSLLPGATQLQKPSASWQALWTVSPCSAQASVGLAWQARCLHVHPSLGLAVVQHTGTGHWDSVQSVPIGRLSPADADAAQRLLSISVLRLCWPLNAASIAPLHSSLHFWAGQGTSNVSKRLSFKPRIYLLEGGQLAAYSLGTGQMSEVAALPRKGASGQGLSARRLVCSLKADASLVFFLATSPAGLLCSFFIANHRAKGPAASTEFTLLSPSSPSKAVWTAQGASGAFAGLEDEQYAVLSNSGNTVRVYATQPSEGKPSMLRKLELGFGGAAALFPGPPWASLPRPGAAQDAGGRGVITWASHQDGLCLGELAGSVRQGTSYVGSYGSSLQASRSLPLAPLESILQVAWQGLLDESGGGSVMDDTGAGKASIAAAVLTSRRLLLVSATLRPLCAFSPSPSDAPITSFLWLGPALLFCNSAHQVDPVRQLAWDGHVASVCSLGGGPPAVLAGALADRLLVGRGGAGVSSRQVALLPSLLLGWASLAACSILPGGWWRARQEMATLIASYDSSTVDETLLSALVGAGASKAALALAKHQVGGVYEKGLAATEGHWEELVSAALAAHRQSPQYPRPPARGSEEWARLVGLGRAAAAYGQCAAARQLWEAAAAWPELLGFCALQGDFDAVRGYCNSEDPEVKALAKTLMVLSEDRFRSATAVGASPRPSDWQISFDEQGITGDTEGEEAWQVAPAGSVPNMDIAPAPGSTSVTMIPQMDPTLLEGYLGLGQAPERGASGVSPWHMGDELGADEDDGGFMEASPIDRTPGDDEGANPYTAGQDTSAGRRSGNNAQEAAHAAFTQDKDTGFYSSDEDEDSQSTTSLSTTTSNAGPKFKVVIKDKDAAAPSTTDAGTLWAAAQSLRLSAQPPSFSDPARPLRSALSGSDSRLSDSDFKVSPAKSGAATPASLPPRGAGISPGASSSSSPGMLPLPPLGHVSPLLQPPVSSRGGSVPPKAQANLFGAARGGGRPLAMSAPAPPPMIPEDLFAQPGALPAAPLPTPPSPAPAPPAGAADEKDVSSSHEGGVQHMESGRWNEAATAFVDALHHAKGKAVPREAQYLAAVRLCKEASDMSKSASAKLMRFAAALDLDPKHQRALAQTAIARNMAVGNYGYAATQLESLVAISVGHVPDSFLQQLQQLLKDCDKHGSTDADISADEDTTTFPEIVGASTTSAEVSEFVDALLRA